jgi:uncharacterized protein
VMPAKPPVLLMLALLSGCSLALAQDPATRPLPLPHTIRAVGEATVTAKPDQVRISLGVTTQAQTAEQAVSEDAAKVTKVLASLKSVVGSDGDLKTAAFSVGPQYRYTQGQDPTIIGYQANHTVLVTLNDVTRAGQLIDAAAKSGANVVNQIEFTLKDDQAVREQAVGKAASVARANAEAIAKAVGANVLGLAWAETNESNVIRPLMAPMMKARMAQAAEPATPIESGNLEVRASVTVALEVK